MSTAWVASNVSPPYVDPITFPADGELPAYSRNAAADERVISAKPTLPIATTTTSSAASRFVFESSRLKLDLGERKWPVKVPCYGWNGTVEGSVYVRKFKAVLSITVTLEGVCSTAIVERGMVIHTTPKPVLSTSQVLWARTEGQASPEEPEEFLFSFPIPTRTIEGDVALPHSYAVSHPGMRAKVAYHVRVDIVRKGLRRHECLKIMIIYLPRSTPPEIPVSIPNVPQWQTISIFPKFPQPTNKRQSRRNEEEGKDPAQVVNITLPFPRAYASAAPIPFHLSFPADSRLLHNLADNLTIHLIKYSTIEAGGLVSVQNGIIGVGEILGVGNDLYPTPTSPTASDSSLPLVPRKVYRGKVQSFREGGESSFRVPGLLEVRYSLRVRIQLPERRRKNAKRLPEYFIDQNIVMCTHNHIPDAEDLHHPVIGLIAITGSAGVPTPLPTREETG